MPRLALHRAEEADIGDVVLAAGVEAAADLHVQILALGHLTHAVVKLFMQQRGQTA